MIIDQAAAFGTIVVNALNNPTYSGPLIQNFVARDTIDLKDIAFSGASLSYNTSSGLLQVKNGSAVVASLLFDKTTLGSGGISKAIDATGHIMITHS